MTGQSGRHGGTRYSAESAVLTCGLLTVGGGYAAQVNSMAPFSLDLAPLLDWAVGTVIRWTRVRLKPSSACWRCPGRGAVPVCLNQLPSW